MFNLGADAMSSKIISTLNWAPYYFARELGKIFRGDRTSPGHVYFCICDHFEPYWNGADRTTARKRIQCWLDKYPIVADKYPDADGNVLKYSFFYPEEEYFEPDLRALADLCHAGYGEVEIHLHHDNDTSDNLRRTLIDYKHRLHEKHGLLSVDEKTGEIVYGFIHGNWSLCNSRRDGRWCGVNDEIKILLETGCYADFTMPSAPSDTQTRKLNSIYYAVDIPGRSKSHDWGMDAKVGKPAEGLLMVQGPLCLNWHNRKFGLLPRIENSGLYSNSPPSRERLQLWVKAGISVRGAADHVFVKLYTHGAQDDVMKMLFDDGFAAFFDAVKDLEDRQNIKTHFVSARELAMTIKTLTGIV